MTGCEAHRDEPTWRFSDQVEQHHQRIDPTAWDDLYVVGDIHGCREPFERLLDRLNIESTDLVVCVGDLVRKGPDSAGVVDIVRDNENILSVRGNNEQKVLDGRKTVDGIDGDDIDFLQTLPLAISWEDLLVVHGGIDPTTALSTQGRDTVLTMRSHHGNGYDGPFWFDAHEGPPRVFFGHTVLAAPIEREWAVGVDTGCVYGGSLTAYDVTDGVFVSVPAETTHQSRPQEKFLADGQTGKP